jgi:hypothetical protein
MLCQRRFDLIQLSPTKTIICLQAMSIDSQLRVSEALQRLSDAGSAAGSTAIPEATTVL